MWIVTGVSAGCVALLLAWGTQAWWEDGLKPFRFRETGGFGRDTYAGGADKIGHAYSNYMLTHVGAALYRSLGMSRARAAWYSGIATFLLGNWFELIDGFTDFGFEYGDVIANTVGAALGIVTQLYPELDETIGMRIAYVPSNDFLDNDKTLLKWINDYSGMSFYADVKLRGLFRLFDTDPGFARFLLVGLRHRRLLTDQTLRFAPALAGTQRRDRLRRGAALAERWRRRRRVGRAHLRLLRRALLERRDPEGPQQRRLVRELRCGQSVRSRSLTGRSRFGAVASDMLFAATSRRPRLLPGRRR
jgi:hypothetical protein